MAPRGSTRDRRCLELSGCTRPLPTSGAGDWGEVTLALTRELGTTFAVLNMANAEWPGGAYVEGAVAQEENMFRRTDCHFAVSDGDVDAARGGYHPAMTLLINGVHGAVYLDTARPRVCIRGPEVPAPAERATGGSMTTKSFLSSSFELQLMIIAM